MRAALVWALVLGSLVFSVGGVAVVGLADSDQSQPQAQVTPHAAQTPAPHVPKLSTAAPKECKPPTRNEVRSRPAKDAADTIVLNTRGYNYARPGDFGPSPSSDAPPAAPAPK